MEYHALRLLDEAMSLAQQALKKVQEKKTEEAQRLALEWEKLVNEAFYNHYEPAIRKEFIQRLDEILKIQRQTIAIATEELESVRADMQLSKKEQGRMKGYRAAVIQARR
ncbi:MAG: hypothetical protein IJU76_11625 [Desulfovibrionaceae bacterium]|nr:hypothetical protein [Desulfovibrionaceae bacterium]